MQVHAVFNRDGGTFRTLDIAAFALKAKEIFEQHGHAFQSDIVAGKDIVKALENAAARDRDGVLMAGGGDGTISAAAAVAWKTGIPLAVLPAGTMNLFARSLKIPLELYAALESLASGVISAADISTANERAFVHQFAIGFQPRMIKLRNTLEYSSQWGKRLASMRAFAKVIGRPPRFAVRLTIDGASTERTVSAISVSNNPYGRGLLPIADSLDQGKLGVYIADRISLSSLAKLAATVLMGSWRNNNDVDEILAGEVDLHFPHLHGRKRATIDGELVPLERDVVIKVHAGALRVLVPAEPSPK